MAAPTYLTDLANIDTAEALGTWVETGTWTAGTAPALEPDVFIQGSNSISKYMTSGGVGVGGCVMNFGSGITIPSPGAFFLWLNQQCPNNIDTLANGGLRAIIGNLSTAFNAWKLRGKDTYAYGGWTCYPVDPAVTPDYTVGVPTATRQWFGAAVNQLANAKGGTNIDVMRYGRGELKSEFGSTADGYATFTGAAAQNDTNTNRWGLCQAIDGGFLIQGLFLLGSATNAVDHRSSNTSIIIPNTINVISTFNLFEIRNASSRVDWTSISFQALGTISRGNFTVTNNATVNWIGCTFTDVGLFSLLAATIVTNCIFRRTDKITTGGATFSGCTIDSNRATTAMLCATPAQATLISNTKFISDGTGYAIEITGTVANITLVGNTYSGYAATNGSTGNEAIFVNIATGTINISISGGDIPTIRTAGATVNIISSNTLTISGFLTGSDVVIYEAGTSNILDSVDSSVPTSFIYSYTGADTIDIGVFKAGHIPLYIRNLAITLTNSTLPVSQVVDRAYLL